MKIKGKAKRTRNLEFRIFTYKKQMTTPNPQLSWLMMNIRNTGSKESLWVKFKDDVLPNCA